MSQTRLPDLLLDNEQIRHRSMQSLFESLENLCEGTVVVDREARIVWINERYASRLGAISAADAIGRPIEDIIPSSLMREVVTSGQPILLDLLETSDTTFVVTRIPIKDDNGEVIGAAGFALFDQVQSLKPLFAKLERMQREIANAQKRRADGHAR
ncbi:PAS domain-containing protein [Propionivibrio sp.]|uniref:PAS domain-containing protein n=1 Tax=Propionivibrio sp. TaxID=2212460 RepID=UPI003BF3E72F